MVCRKSRRKYVDVVWTFAFWIDAVKTDIHDISDIDRRKLVHQAVFGVIFVLTITSVMGAFQDGFSFFCEVLACDFKSGGSFWINVSLRSINLLEVI